MVKIFLDPGHGGTDPGAVGNGLMEKNLTLQIARKIESFLKAEYEGVTIRMSRTGDQTVSLNERTNAANAWGADFYLSIHINAGGGTGFESYVYPSAPVRTNNYQREIHEEVMKQIDMRDRGMKQANFHVLRETTMDAVLTENGFIDTAADAQKLKSSTFINQIARGYVNGIAQAFKLKKKASNPQQSTSSGSTNTSNTIYKVQIGAFSNRENAEELAERARAAGFNVFIDEE